MNDNFMIKVISAYEAGGLDFINDSTMNLEEARKIFKKDLKKTKVKFDEKMFRAHYVSAKMELLSVLMQYYPVLIDETKRKQIIEKAYEVVKELYENENKEEK